MDTAADRKTALRDGQRFTTVRGSTVVGVFWPLVRPARQCWGLPTDRFGAVAVASLGRCGGGLKSVLRRDGFAS